VESQKLALLKQICDLNHITNYAIGHITSLMKLPTALQAASGIVAHSKLDWFWYLQTCIDLAVTSLPCKRTYAQVRFVHNNDSKNKRHKLCGNINVSTTGPNMTTKIENISKIQPLF
jgi:hypothetical protein